MARIVGNNADEFSIFAGNPDRHQRRVCRLKRVKSTYKSFTLDIVEIAICGEAAVAGTGGQPCRDQSITQTQASIRNLLSDLS